MAYITNKVKNVNGNSITIDDGLKLKSLQLQGDTYQQTYSGKNLFNKSLETINKTIDTSTGNVDITANDRNTSDYIRINGSTRYTCNVTMTRYAFYNSDKTFISSGITATTVTTPSNAYYMRFSYVNSLENIMLEQGSQATSYEPYVGGQPSPNPDYPQPIETVTGRQEVQVIGKNLIQPLDDGSQNGLTFTTNDDGITTISGTATGNVVYYKYLYETIPAGTYTLSVNLSYAPPTNSSQLILEDTSNNRLAIINLWSTLNKTFTISKETELKDIYFYSNTGVSHNGTISIQLEKGSQATEYQPFIKHKSEDLFTEEDYQNITWGDNVGATHVAYESNVVVVTSNGSNSGIYFGMKDYIKNFNTSKKYYISFDVTAEQEMTLRYGSDYTYTDTVIGATKQKLQIEITGSNLNAFTFYSRDEQAGQKYRISDIVVTTDEPYYEINLGKNLFDKDNVINNANINSSGQIISDIYKLYYVKVQSGKTYTMSIGKNRQWVYAFYETIPQLNSTGSARTVNTSINETFTVPSGYNYIAIREVSDTVESTTNLQLEEGNQATSYAPYFTPIELCKIDTYQDKIAKSTGKNLFDINDTTHILIDASGVITENNAFSTTDYIGTKPNTNYYYSSTQKVGQTGSAVIIAYYNKDKSFISREAYQTLGHEFTTPTNCYYMRIVGFTQNQENIMVEQNTQATEYEPYGTNWYIKKAIGKVVLDGSEDWQTNTFYTDCSLFNLSYSSAFVPTDFTQIYIMSDYFTGASRNLCASNDGKNTCALGNANPRIWINIENEIVGSSNQLTNFKTWLSTHNTIVYYVLATPTYEIITNEELIKQLDRIKLIEGTNNIDVDSGDLPVILNIDYYSTENPYEDVIYSQSAKNKLKILFDGVELQNADRYCEKITRTYRILPNDGSKRFSLGNFISQELTIILHDIDTSIIKDQVEVYLGTLVENEYTYIPLGIFNIQGTPTTDKDKTTIKLRDNRVKFDFGYNAKPLIDANGGKATKKQILNDMCDKANVISDVGSFLGENDEVSIYDSSIIATAYVSYIAEQAGMTPIINRYGHLQFINYKDAFVHKIPLNILEKYELGKKYKIQRVVYEDEIVKLETSNDNTLDTLYIDSANPYITNQEHIDNIFSKLEDFEIDSLKTGKVLGNPAIDPYDIIEVYGYYEELPNENKRFVNDKNVIVAKTLANYNLTYNKVMISEYNTIIGEEQRKENITISGEKTYRKYARAEYNALDASINLLAEETIDGDNPTSLRSLIKVTPHTISLTTSDGGTSAGIKIKLYDENGNQIGPDNDANITMSGKVSFTDLSTSNPTTTIINGDNITTGAIKSANYVADTSGTKINLTDGTIDSKNFKVNSTGEITATAGAIGGWGISSTALIKQIGDYNFEIRTDRASNEAALLVYDRVNTQYNWFVRPDGYMYARDCEIHGTVYATNGSFSGSITSTSGTIGGWTIDGTSGLYKGSGVYIYNDGRMSLKKNGWLNAGDAGYWLLGNGSNYKCLIGDSYNMGSNISDYLKTNVIVGSSWSVSEVNGYVGMAAITGGIVIKSEGDTIAMRGLNVNITASNSMAVASMDTLYLKAVSHDVNINSLQGNVNIQGQPYISGSSRNMKTNIKKITPEEEIELYNAYKNMSIYNYDYLKRYGGEKNQIGFILEELDTTLYNRIGGMESEEDKNIKRYNPTKLITINTAMINILIKKIEELEEKYEQAIDIAS